MNVAGVYSISVKKTYVVYFFHIFNSFTMITCRSAMFVYILFRFLNFWWLFLLRRKYRYSWWKCYDSVPEEEYYLWWQLYNFPFLIFLLHFLGQISTSNILKWDKWISCKRFLAAYSNLLSEMWNSNSSGVEICYL